MSDSSASAHVSLESLSRRTKRVFGIAVIDGFRLDRVQIAGTAKDSLFQAGSISKSLTSLVALELVTRGSFDLDEDIETRLTSWEPPRRSNISLRQLLAHTSGAGIPFFPGYSQQVESPSLRQVLDGDPQALTPAIEFDPAKRGLFSYSGGGYAVVQQLIEDVTGESFARVAHDVVLSPLGMDHSTFEQPLPARLRSRAARSDWNVYPESGAAGLWTTPEDLGSFVIALQHGLADDAAPMARSPREMLTPHAELPLSGPWNIFPLLGLRPPYAHGLGMFLHDGDRFSNFGGASRFCSALSSSMVTGNGVVVMMASNPSPFLFKLLRKVGDEYGWTGFRQPGLGRLNGLPGLRRIARNH